MYKENGLKVDLATNLADALQLSKKPKYKLAVVDMEIPAPGSSQKLLDTPISTQYHGFKVADHLRNIGYSAHQIIAYTVHDDDSLDAELDKIRCRYVLKGRPNILKSVIHKGFIGKAPKEKWRK